MLRDPNITIYRIVVVSKMGVKNGAADALSRRNEIGEMNCWNIYVPFDVNKTCYYLSNNLI